MIVIPTHVCVDARMICISLDLKELVLFHVLIHGPYQACEYRSSSGMAMPHVFKSEVIRTTDGYQRLRSWLHSWVGECQQEVLREHEVPGLQSSSVHVDEPLLPKGSGLFRCCYPCAVLSRTFALLLCGPRVFCLYRLRDPTLPHVCVCEYSCHAWS